MVMTVVLLFGFPAGSTTHAYVFPVLPFFPAMPISETNPVTVEGMTLGRYLFYDKILSSDRQMACATCHQQAQAFSDAPMAFSLGRNDVPTARNTMPLFNLAWYSAYFWDGRAAHIEEQVLHPVRNPLEMNLPWTQAANRLRQSRFYRLQFKAAFGEAEIDSTTITKAIGQFLRTLISHRSKFDRVLAGEALLSKAEFDGFVLMNDQTKGDCLHCHTSDADALGTTRTFSNNGLDAMPYPDLGLGAVTNAARDGGKFKIPSLRNVVFTAPYMHDGRFATLEEVLDFYSEGVKMSSHVDSKMGTANKGGVHLSPIEKQNIIAFLHTLSDSAFVRDPAFANPFVQ